MTLATGMPPLPPIIFGAVTWLVTYGRDMVLAAGRVEVTMVFWIVTPPPPPDEVTDSEDDGTVISLVPPPGVRIRAMGWDEDTSGTLMWAGLSDTLMECPPGAGAVLRG
jgi:hypothetical protein